MFIQYIRIILVRHRCILSVAHFNIKTVFWGDETDKFIIISMNGDLRRCHCKDVHTYCHNIGVIH